MMSKPTAAALGGKGSMPAILELTGSFLHIKCGGKMEVVMKEFTLTANKDGQDKMKRCQFWDQCRVCREVFALLDWL